MGSMRAFSTARVRVQVVGCVHGRSRHTAARAEADPLMVRAARSEAVERAPAWMMRQAGRYMAAYRALADKHPGFRERSETTDLIVEISLQPHEAFAPDGVILFSDILTPLEACGVPFEIDNDSGPVIDAPIRSKDGLSALHAIDLDRLAFVGESLKQISNTVRPGGAATLGFVGAPWTIATYVIEGRPTQVYRIIKRMANEAPELLDAVLSHLAEQIGEYVCYQIESGADYIQIFDSWGGQLAPSMWDKWSRPYIERIISTAKQRHPQTPIMVYANGAGGLIERLGATGADVVGLDWMVDIGDARQRLGPNVAVQGNLDPVLLFGEQIAIKNAVDECLQKAGNRGHILNLGHGVAVGTPEENVKYVFDLAKQAKY